MGMFDDIDAPAEPCPKCGKPTSRWQSKDGDCTLDRLPREAVQNYYTFCDDCGTKDGWIEFSLIDGKWVRHESATHSGRTEATQ